MCRNKTHHCRATVQYSIGLLLISFHKQTSLMFAYHPDVPDSVHFERLHICLHYLMVENGCLHVSLPL